MDSIFIMFRNSFKLKVVIFLVLGFNYSIAQNKKKLKLITDLNVNVGITAFKNPFYNNLLNNDFPRVCKAITFGLDFYNKNKKIAFELRKTHWLFLSPSNFIAPVSGTGAYDYIGFYKNLETKKHKLFQISVGYTFIRENGYYLVNYAYNKFNKNYSPFRQRGLLSRYRGVFNTYTSEAITLGAGYHLSKHFFIDLKANYYIKSYNQFFKLGLNENRMQFSILYKINPDKK